MKREDLDKGSAFLSQKVRRLNVIPGKILMREGLFVSELSKFSGWSNMEANLFANILLNNGIISLDGSYIKLTEKGYSFVYDEDSDELDINLLGVLPIEFSRHDNETVFYFIWNVVGNDKGENPFYVDGNTFYQTISHYIDGLPPSYSRYMSVLKEKRKSISRSEWCRELFCKLSKDEIPQFLNRLSDVINRNKSYRTEYNGEIEIKDAVGFPIQDLTLKMEDNKKTPKMFISHNSQDSEYAKALVQLLMGIGVNEEKDVFCSSLPGCGVKFGKSFIQAIREQYERHDLIMLFIHSPRYYDSHVSLCELGAAWIMKNEHFSFLTSDCDFCMLDAVVPPTETAFKAGQKNTYHFLNEFKGFIEKRFNLEPKSLNRWEVIKNDFIVKVSCSDNNG